ncbi:MAG TPA: DUF2905 domain-containing protein [Firmicutes bacterium]|nr:DUF2905 domain-containing protein [Bacillota bacterium]
MNLNLGKTLIYMGIFLILIGGLFTLGGRIPSLGRLPGDITWRRGNVTVYFPLGTSLLLSAILSLILYLLQRVR